MTTGNPLTLILQFMLPVLLGQLVQQTYNMVDAMIVGRMIGASALAAVGASSSVQFMVLGFCSGTSDGFSIPIAQRFGAGDMRGVRRNVWHAVLLAAGFIAVLTLLTALLCPWILRLLHTPDDIYTDAYRYLLVIFLGLPFTIFYNLQASILRAVGNSRIPFIFLAVSASLNIFLDLFCVAVMKWGCVGAAVATVTSQALSGIFCLIYIVKKMKMLHPSREEREWHPQTAKNLMWMGLPMGFQFSITAIGSMVMQGSNNALGSMYVSGYTAADRVEAFIMAPHVALSSSVATYVGQNFGALRFDRIRTGVKQSITLAVGYGVVFGCLMAFFGKYAAAMFLPAGSEEILKVSQTFLWYVGLGFWLVSSVNVFRPAIQGLGKPAMAIISGVIEMAARTIFSLTMVPLLGFTGVSLCHQAAWLTAGIYVLVMYRSLIRKMEERMSAKETV